MRTKIRGRWLLDLADDLAAACFPASSWAWRSCVSICSCRFRCTARLWILLIAFVTRYIPYGIRYTHSGLLQLHKELEEASYVSGASWFSSMRRIILPLMTPSFLGGWIFIFLLSAKELSMSVLARQPANAGGVGRDLRALGKCPGRRARRLRRDLDRDPGHRRDRLLSLRPPLRDSAELTAQLFIHPCLFLLPVASADG